MTQYGEPSGVAVTVLGEIDVTLLGTTHTHEHCFIDLSVWFSEPEEASRKRDADGPVVMRLLSDLRRRPFSTVRTNMILDDELLIRSELDLYKQAGGGTIVDVTVIGLGRDPKALQRLARATGLNIIMGTGFYVENAQPDSVRDMTVEDIAALMIGDIRDGVGTTDVRCGIIGEIGLSGIQRGNGRQKTAAVTSEEEKVLRGAAQASMETDVPVSVHLDPIEPRAGTVAVDILESEGMDPSKMIIGHVDQVHDLDYHKALADRGVYVQYDSFGRDHYAEEWGADFDWGHDSWRVRYLTALVERGHQERILMSQDVCMKTDLREFGGNGYAHILTNIVPTLHSLGLSKNTIDELLVTNPARVLSCKSWPENALLSRSNNLKGDR